MDGRMRPLAVLAVILCTGAALCGCSGQPKPPSLRKAVRSAQATPDYPRRSRICYLQDELPAGSTVTPRGDCPGEAAVRRTSA